MKNDYFYEFMSIKSADKKCRFYNPVKYIEIYESYKENKESKYKKIEVEKYMRKIRGMDDTEEKRGSLFEVLDSDNYFILYFDIECIDYKQDNLINEIINDLMTFVYKTSKIHLLDYALTINRGSSNHDGLSYHLYFPNYKTKQRNIYNLLSQFLSNENYIKYKNYIDTSVYSHNRLFRSVFQRGITDKLRKENDEHLLVHGNISDTIIQNIEDAKLFDFNYKQSSIKLKKISKPSIIHDEKLLKLLTVLDNKIELKNNDDKTIKRCINIIQPIQNHKPLKENHEKIVLELIDYYEQHNSFEGYKMNLSCINSILNTIENFYK